MLTADWLSWEKNIWPQKNVTAIVRKSHEARALDFPCMFLPTIPFAKAPEMQQAGYNLMVVQGTYETLTSFRPLSFSHATCNSWAVAAAGTRKDTDAQ